MSWAKVESFGRALAASPVVRAFAISVALHFLLFAGVEVGRHAGWWKHSLLPQRGKSRIEQEVARAEEQLKKQIQQAFQNQVPEAQLVFVEVDPSVPVIEPPKDTKFYSSQSSVASNPDPGDKEVPKIDGTQKQVPKTFDTLKPAPPSADALQPSPPEPKPAEPKPASKEMPKVESKEPQPKPAIQEDIRAPRDQKPGETLVARAAPRPQPPQREEEPEPPRRPRTLAEARAQKGIIEGQKMRQEGGARKLSVGMNLDVKGTPFGAYDRAFIEAVQSRWFNLLDERQFMPNEAGKVVVEFRLNFDGRITGLRVVESEVNEHLSWTCQRAVLDPAPYRPFPSDMRRMVNNDYREIRFTFYYN
jgi:hypothetical protein